MTYRGPRLWGRRKSHSTRQTVRRNTADSKAGRLSLCISGLRAVCRTPSTQSVSCAKLDLLLPYIRQPRLSASTSSHDNQYKYAMMAIVL